MAPRRHDHKREAGRVIPAGGPDPGPQVAACDFVTVAEAFTGVPFVAAALPYSFPPRSRSAGGFSSGAS